MQSSRLAASVVAATVLAATFTVCAAATASANASEQDGPVSITVKGTGTVVGETYSTYASHGGEGQVQAYYIVVGPNGRSSRINSERVQDGAKGSGVYRDSYGPSGGFLPGTRVCAGWWDPTGRVHISGYPCVTLHS